MISPRIDDFEQITQVLGGKGKVSPVGDVAGRNLLQYKL